MFHCFFRAAMPMTSAPAAGRSTATATEKLTYKGEMAATPVALLAVSKQQTGPRPQASATPMSTAAKHGKKR